MTQAEFDLRFVEGFHAEDLRRCEWVKKIAVEQGVEGMLVRVFPPYSGAKYGLREDISLLVLTPKYQDDSLWDFNDWPKDVYVLLPLIEEPESREILAQSETQKIAFGELCLGQHRRVIPSAIRLTNPF
ncbi:MAG TPA: hypothetical protein VGM02_05355 [Acidobacteriaceae bacterium]|jgi:hypothetical protein